MLGDKVQLSDADEVIFLRENWTKIPWRSESKKRPMPIEGIKMSLIHSCPPPPLFPMSLTHSHSLSLLKLGWWPSATKNTKANKSSSFQHLPSPKGLPTPTTPSPVKMGPWLYSSFSIPPYSPHWLPLPDWQNIYSLMSKWRRDPLFPCLTKAVWSQDGDCQPRCLGPGRGAPSPPYTFLPPSGSSIPCFGSLFYF